MKLQNTPEMTTLTYGKYAIVKEGNCKCSCNLCDCSQKDLTLYQSNELTATIPSKNISELILSYKVCLPLPDPSEVADWGEDFDWIRKNIAVVLDDSLPKEMLEEQDIKWPIVVDPKDDSYIYALKRYALSEVLLKNAIKRELEEIVDYFRAEWSVINLRVNEEGFPLSVDRLDLKGYTDLFNLIGKKISDQIPKRKSILDHIHGRSLFKHTVIEIMGMPKELRDMLKEPEGEAKEAPPAPKKEKAPTKEQLTRSANKARDTKKKEQEDYARRVAEAEKRRLEDERRKQALKKAKKQNK